MNSKTPDIQTQTINIQCWILSGLLIRLGVIPFTFHGDILYINSIPHLLSHGEWDAYQTAKEVFDQNYYPPLTLIFFGFIQFFLGSVSNDYEEFTHSITAYNVSDALEFSSLFKILFLLKAPYLIFDGLFFGLAIKLFKKSLIKFSFITLWALNPIVIYGTYMIGQFDLIPSFLVFFAFYCCTRRGLEIYAPLALAVGCLFKIFPLIFLPMVTLIISRDFPGRIRYFLIGVLPVIVFYTIFYITSGPSVMKLFSDLSYNTERSFHYKIFTLRILQASTYALVCWHIFRNNENSRELTTLIQYFLIIYLAIFWGLNINWTHYLIWLMPFLVLYATESKSRKYIYYFLLAIVFLAGLRARPSCFGIFAPLNPDFFLSLPSLKDITGYLFNQHIYDRVIDILFKGTTGAMAFLLLKELYFQNLRKA